MEEFRIAMVECREARFGIDFAGFRETIMRAVFSSIFFPTGSRAIQGYSQPRQ